MACNPILRLRMHLTALNKPKLFLTNYNMSGNSFYIGNTLKQNSNKNIEYPNTIGTTTNICGILHQ